MGQKERCGGRGACAIPEPPRGAGRVGGRDGSDRIWPAAPHAGHAVALVALVGTLTALRDAATFSARQRPHARGPEPHDRVVADSPAPYIFERTGERYAHIFIDEFQDTSVMQWRNLAVAVGETLSHGKLSLVVGDAKQAIYRWRNGDHRQLMALPGFAKEAGETLPEALVDAAGRMNDEQDIQPIEENWRSAPQVVDFNNRLYPALVEGLGEEVAEVYADVAQTPRKSFPGGVEVEVVEADRAEARFGLAAGWSSGSAALRRLVAETSPCSCGPTKRPSGWWNTS